MLSSTTRELIRRRLGDERGRLDKEAPLRVGLAYPSPYHVAMSSLGFQQVYRLLCGLDGVTCERLFLSDDAARGGSAGLEPAVSYEGLRQLGEFPLVAFSVAYELELAGLVRMLDAAGLPLLAADRDRRHPLLIAGGPLTFSNPLPLSPFVDAIVLGEAEEVLAPLVEVVRRADGDREVALEALSALPHVFVPARQRELPELGRASDALLPARSVIVTPHTELSDMFLIEAERGCSRGCQYCVMRRSTNGGMRVIDRQVVLDAIPEDMRRVGLVGAAVSDHPRIVQILDSLAERGAEVGLSSLRPDRLKLPLVEALGRVGYRTLTTALDGASQRLRDTIERRGRREHYVAAAEHARAVGMNRLKLYLMVGLPGEQDEDMDECSRFVSELSRILPVALGIAPFCAKRRTPFDGASYAGVEVVQRRLARLRTGLKGRAEVRATSAKWAWVEYALSQGGAAEGLAVAEAVRSGERFADYRRALEALGWSTKAEVRPPEGRHGQAAPLVTLRRSGPS